MMVMWEHKELRLKDKAVTVPAQLGACVSLDPQKAQTLYTLLYEVIGKLT
jgi:hypothetical protein